jgi:hypothetical protein
MTLLRLGGSLSVGASKRGTCNVIPITGTLDARYVLASNDGEFVVVRNCGLLARSFRSSKPVKITFDESK